MTDDEFNNLPEGEGHDWNTCKDENCQVCQFLVNEGIILACDGCHEPGHTDSPGGWTRDDKDGMVYCDACAEARGLNPFDQH